MFFYNLYMYICSTDVNLAYIIVYVPVTSVCFYIRASSLSMLLHYVLKVTVCYLLFLKQQCAIYSHEALINVFKLIFSIIQC